MFYKGDRVLLDLEAANAWRKSVGRDIITEELIGEHPITISTNTSREDKGVEVRYVWLGRLNRYVPVNSLSHFQLDKKAISQMLVRMQ